MGVIRIKNATFTMKMWIESQEGEILEESVIAFLHLIFFLLVYEIKLKSE